MSHRVLFVLAAMSFPLLAQDGPAAPTTVDEAVTRSIEILLEMQEGETKDQWPYEGVYKPSGRIPVGYRCGGTSIAAIALMESPGYAQDSKRREAVHRAAKFVLGTLEEPLMASGFKGRYDVRGWGHTYALLFFLKLESNKDLPEDLAKRVPKAANWLTRTLIDTAIPKSGGWNYSRPASFGSSSNAASPFMTGPTLQALFAAKASGRKVPNKVVKSALVSLERGRTQSGGYAYKSPRRAMEKAEESKLGMMDRKPGSSGRMCAAESTLTLAGQGDPKRLLDAINNFFEHHDALKVRKRKNNTHIPPYGVAPYYFMYAHYYAAQAIELLPQSEKRDELRSRMAELMIAEQEPDGGWNDRVFPRSRNFGTAFGMMALLMPKMSAPVRWSNS